jgi:hypothetical protein
MIGWTNDELDRIAAAQHLEIAPETRDGILRRPVTIWVVRVDDDLYVRSWRGPAGGWFRAAQQTRGGHISAGGVEKDVRLVDADDNVNDTVDDAYRHKYGRHADSYVEPMIQAEARATTLKLIPRDGAQ